MLPIQFPPGVTNLLSKNSKIVNWRECNLIRWDEGVTMKPVGGWELTTIPTFTDKIRKMHKWSDNNNNLYTAFLCETHCYVQLPGGNIQDITPTGGMTPGPSNQAGYNDYLYNYGTYGTPRPGAAKPPMYPATYSLDNWGDELRAMTSNDGRLLAWKPSTPTVHLVAVTGAPINNRSFVITPERHIMLFGMSAEFDKFGWCDEEDDTNWAFTDVLSRAGYYNISPKSPIVAHESYDGGILMFTQSQAFRIRWIGLPYIYEYKSVGSVAPPISPASVCETPIGIIWPSTDGWWLFDGVSARVIPCDIWDFILRTTDITNSRNFAACAHLMDKGEVWWFYTSPPTSTKNTRYAAYDYRSKIWTMGKLSRNCGFVYANERFPLMADDYNVYKHEIGRSYPGAEEMPWIESFNLTPNGGENWLTVNKILPDVFGDASALRWRMAKTNDRNGYTSETYSPQRQKNGNGWVDIRETARDMRLRIDMVSNSDWGTVGPILFDSKMRGKK
jgi:hypothetical protein